MPKVKRPVIKHFQSGVLVAVDGELVINCEGRQFRMRIDTKNTPCNSLWVRVTCYHGQWQAIGDSYSGKYHGRPVPFTSCEEINVPEEVSEDVHTLACRYAREDAESRGMSFSGVYALYTSR